jgi:hypothetical protein
MANGKITKLESLSDLPGDAELIRITYADGSSDEQVMDYDERYEIVAQSGVAMGYVFKEVAR